MKRKTYQEMYLRDGKDKIHLLLLRKPVSVRNQSMSLAGYVSSKPFSENIPLVIDHRPKNDDSYEYACVAMDSVGHVRVLMEPEVYWDFLRGKPYARTTIHRLNSGCEIIASADEFNRLFFEWLISSLLLFKCSRLCPLSLSK